MVVKLKPKYSYEFNVILNEKLDENEQIKNFASLITDKDRFFALFEDISNNKNLIEKYLGFELPEEVEFYVVRCEKFDSFSEPITIEYKLNPEEMIINLLKEIIKVNFPVNFPDENTRETYIIDFLSFIFNKIDSNKYSKFLNKKFENYEEKNFVERVKEFYDDNPDFLENLYKKQQEKIDKNFSEKN